MSGCHHKVRDQWPGLPLLPEPVNHLNGESPPQTIHNPGLGNSQNSGCPHPPLTLMVTSHLSQSVISDRLSRVMGLTRIVIAAIVTTRGPGSGLCHNGVLSPARSPGCWLLTPLTPLSIYPDWEGSCLVSIHVHPSVNICISIHI